MAELRPPVEPSLNEKSEYQPLSPVALAAVIVSGLFATIILVLAFTAIWSGKPVVVPALLFLALIGIALAVVARMQIDQAEGTRAGRGLATAAWWMSILGGATYAAYLAAMIVAIRSQSLDTAEKWFTMLRSGDVQGSFLLTLDPGRRTGINPRNLADIEGRFGEAEWPAYRMSELVRTITRNGEQAQLIPAGVRDWSHEPSGFNVVRSFILKCPEGEFDLSLALFGNEGRDLNRRIWNLKFAGDSSITKRKLSAYGRAIVDMQYQMTGITREFLTFLNRKVPELAFIVTREPDLRKKLTQLRFQNDLHKLTATLSQPPSLNLSPIVVASLLATPYKPDGMDQFPKSGFFRLPGGATPSAEQQAMFESIWKENRIAPSGSSGPSMLEAIPIIEVKDDEIRGSVAVEIPFPNQTQYARARLILVARNPELLRIVKELKAEAMAKPDQVELMGASPLAKISGEWQVIALESDLVLQSFQKMDPKSP